MVKFEPERVIRICCRGGRTGNANTNVRRDWLPLPYVLIGSREYQQWDARLKRRVHTNKRAQKGVLSGSPHCLRSFGDGSCCRPKHKSTGNNGERNINLSVNEEKDWGKQRKTRLAPKETSEVCLPRPQMSWSLSVFHGDRWVWSHMMEPGAVHYTGVRFPRSTGSDAT